MTQTDRSSPAHPGTQEAKGPWSVLFASGQAPGLKRPWRRRVLFLLFLVTRGLLRWLPLPVAQILGRCAGAVGYVALRRHRAVAWANVRQALGPAASPRTCRDIVRGVFVNLGKTALEWFVLDRYTPAQIRCAVEVRGAPHLQQALAQGRGVIVVSAHFGNWEVLPMAVTSLGFRGGVMARRLRYPEYESFVTGMRRRHGVSTLRRGPQTSVGDSVPDRRRLSRGSVTEAVRLLKANQILGVVPDQDIDSLEGVFVDFFNRPTYTPSGPAALALMTGAAIVPCFVVRTGRRFRVVIEAPLAVSRTDDRAHDVAAITQQWSRVVESYVRAYPDQWAWVHPRWKTTPEVVARPPRPVERFSVRGGPSTVHRQEEPMVRPSEHTTPRRVAQVALSLFLLAAHGSLLAGVSGCSGNARQSTAPPQEPKAAAPLKASPPVAPLAGGMQQMDTFTMAGYTTDGTKRWDLNGRGAVMEGAFVTVKQPIAMGYGLPDDLDLTTALPRNATLTASLAQVEQSTRRIRMEHDVAIHTSDGLWLFSPMMWWLPDASQLTTDQPVRIETDHMLLRGYGATGHTQLKQAVIERDVEMVLNPSDKEIPGGNSHVEISCDGPLSFDYEHSIATFEDNVHIKDDQGDLYSDRLIAHLDRATRTVHYAEAIGHVRIIQPGNVATGERAVYQPALGKVTLLGAPALTIEDTQQGPSLLGSAPAPPIAGPAGNTEAMAHALGSLESSSSGVAQRDGRATN